MKIAIKKYKFIVLIILVALVTGQQVEAQPYERSRSVTRSFPVTSETEIQIVNKYGNIHLITWEEDSVRFEIDLLVKANKESKVDKAFDFIDFKFKATQYYIHANTVFEGQGQFWSDVSDLASTLFNSGAATQIDYTVYIPAYAELKIINKFGNIYTTDHEANVDIELSNGDLKGHSFTGNTKIKLEFGKAYVNEITHADLLVNYSEFNLDKGQDLVLESKSSEFYFGDLDMMSITSKRDKFEVNSLGTLYGTSSFSYFTIDMLTARVDMKTHYGGLEIKSLMVGPESFNLTSEFTDITLFLDKEKYYDVEIIHNDKTEIINNAGVLAQKERPVEDYKDVTRLNIKTGTLSVDVIDLKIIAKSGEIILENQ